MWPLYMNSTYLYYLREFLNFIHITFKLNILSNHAKHSKRLVLCYVLPSFTILKSLYSIGQLTYLEENNFSFA